MPPVNDARFDSLKLVQDRQVLSGALPVAGFSRLVESLHGSDGNLDYRVQGTIDSQDRPLLRLRVNGTVQLLCQRCLSGLEHKLEFETTLRLVAAENLENEYDDDPDEPDCVVASTAFDLAELIEDEVLLELPAYPRHDAGACAAASMAGESGLAGPGSTKIMAFSALQGLKHKVIQSKE